MRPGVQEGLHTSLKDPQQNPCSDWLLRYATPTGAKGVGLGQLTSFFGQKPSLQMREIALLLFSPAQLII